MIQRIKLNMSDGIREYPYVPDSNVMKEARASGKVKVGDEIIYEDMIVEVMEEPQLLIIGWVKDQVPVFTADDIPHMQFGGMPPEMGNMANASWSFTVNGVPVDPMTFMGGVNINF